MVALAVNDDKDSERSAHANQNESLLVYGRVIWIRNEQRIVIRETGFRLIKAYAVFLDVGTSLSSVPFDPQIGHTYNVLTERWRRK